MIATIALVLFGATLASASHALCAEFEYRSRAWWVCMLGFFAGLAAIAMAIAGVVAA